jgi:glutamyl-tRNA synthetase
VIDRLEALPEWSAAATEDAVRAHAEAIGVKLGQVAQPLRAALTGKSQSPGLFDVMVVLGREESLERLRDQRVPTA